MLRSGHSKLLLICNSYLSCPEKDDADSDLDTTNDATMKLSFKFQSNEYLELGVSKLNSCTLGASIHKSSLMISNKLLSQDGIKVESANLPKFSLDCTNYCQARKISSEMELSSIYGRKANQSRSGHKFSCKTQNLSILKKKNFKIEDHFILEENDCLESESNFSKGLQRQKTSAFGENSKARCFSSIFSKLENIHEQTNTSLDSDSEDGF